MKKNFEFPDNINLKPSTEGRELRIVIVGKTGEGKSSTANTILGLKLIEEDVTARSVTHATSRYRSNFRGRQIFVVDTPGLKDYHHDETNVLKEITRVPQLLADGVHAFVFVFNACCPRFTADDERALAELEKIFGRDVTRYSLAVFTRAEAVLNTMSLAEFIHKQMEAPVFASFFKRIGSRVTAVNNGSTVPAEITRNQEVMISLIDEMVKQRRHRGETEVLTNEMFDIAKREKEAIRRKAMEKSHGLHMYSAVEDAYSSSDGSLRFFDKVRRRLPQTYYAAISHGENVQGDESLCYNSETDKILMCAEEEANRQREEHDSIGKRLLKYFWKKIYALASACTLM